MLLNSLKTLFRVARNSAPNSVTYECNSLSGILFVADVGGSSKHSSYVSKASADREAITDD